MLLLWHRTESDAPVVARRLPVLLLVVLASAFIGSVGLTWIVVPEAAFRFPIAGFTFYGGVIGGAIALVTYCLLVKLPLLATVDLFAAPLAIGHGIGRLGCFFVGCCHGCDAEGTWLVLGFEQVPVQLLESAACFGIGMTVMLLQSWQGRRQGDQIAMYLVLYGTARILLENLRCDERGVVNLGPFSTDSPSTLVAIASILVGLGLLASRHWRFPNNHVGPELPPPTKPGA